MKEKNKIGEITLDYISYFKYIKFCLKWGYGIISFDSFCREKDNYEKFYKDAIVSQRKEKINKLVNRITRHG